MLTTNSIRRKRTSKRPRRPPRLSTIFANLPDMMKLQVLKFVGFSPNDPFILDYVCILKNKNKNKKNIHKLDFFLLT